MSDLPPTLSPSSGSESADASPAPTPVETLRLAAAALGEPRRCRLLLLLMDGARIVGDLVEETGWKQPLVSHHLAALVKAGLADCRVDGRKHWYHIAKDAPPPIDELLRLLSSVVDSEASSKEDEADSPGAIPPKSEESEGGREATPEDGDPTGSTPLVRPRNTSDLEDFLL